MKKIFFYAFLLIQIIPVYAQPETQTNAQTEVRASAYFQTEGEVYAGQQFTLYIQVQTDTSFSTSPTFPEVVLGNASAIRPEQLGISFSERIRGKTYVGIRQRYLLSAQQAGVLSLPAYSFDFSVRDRETGQDVSVTAITEAIEINIVMPPGLESIHNVAVTPSLKISERFDPPLENLKVGDAFLRRVSLESDNSMAFLLPEISFQTQAGVAVYPASPQFEDNSTRGRSHGKRTDSASYVLQREGEYQLPEIIVQWFDTKSEALKTLSLEQRSFQVLSNPEMLEVLVNSDEESRLDSFLEKLLNLVNWVILHIKPICLTLGTILVVILTWNKYSSKGLDVFANVYRQVSHSDLLLTVSLLFTCLFFSRVTLKNKLKNWLKLDKNDSFKESRSWGEIVNSYQKEGGEEFSRWGLFFDLCIFKLKRKSRNGGGFSRKLNP